MCDVKVCMSENQSVYCAYCVYACSHIYWDGTMGILWVTISDT